MDLHIIAGIARGRKLISPPKSAPARPLTGRVKASLFSILQPELPGATVLDLYAGSGSAGLEALSRGAERCIFVEKDARCCEVIRQNLALLKFADQGKVVRDDAVLSLERPGTEASKCDVVLVDPPFKLINESPEYVAELGESLQNNLSEGALVVLRRETNKHIDTPALSVLELCDRRVYGRNCLEFYRR